MNPSIKEIAKAAQRQSSPGTHDVPKSGENTARCHEAFRKFAQCAASAVGSAQAFFISCVLLLVWAATGPAFHFSDTWQLIINTGTTIVTFLMVFLIQSTQNRDAKAMHLKLDELIRAIQGARNRLVDLEKLSDDELKKLEEQFTRVRNKAELD